MYADPRVATFVTSQFEPVRVHVRDQRDLYKELGERYDAQWTPTILVIDPDGRERHRIEGFLPTDDFLAQLTLGLAKSAFAHGRFDEAEQRFRQVVEHHPSTEAAPEALYWAGVARYKASGDPQPLRDTTAAFRERYQDSAWAKKASVWG